MTFGKDEMYRGQIDALESRLFGKPVSNTSKKKHVFCEVWVNEKHRLAYMRLEKTGSSTIISHFTRCGGRRSDPGTCLRQLMPQLAAALDWRSYFAFSVVRNPYARFVSMYSYLTRNASSTRACASLAVPSWGQVYADPLSLAKFCALDGVRKCCKSKSFQDCLYFRHTQQQARCLTTAGGGWAVDNLLRTEHLGEDFVAMLAHLNVTRGAAAGDPPPLPAYLSKPLRLENPSSPGRLAEFYRPPNQHCLQSARRLFADDLRLLGSP